MKGDSIIMKCPYCGGECTEGYVSSRTLSVFESFKVNTIWYPLSEEGKLMKDGMKTMPKKTKGYLCENCRKVYAEYSLYTWHEGTE